MFQHVFYVGRCYYICWFCMKYPMVLHVRVSQSHPLLYFETGFPAAAVPQQPLPSSLDNPKTISRCFRCPRPRQDGVPFGRNDETIVKQKIWPISERHSLENTTSGNDKEAICSGTSYLGLMACNPYSSKSNMVLQAARSEHGGDGATDAHVHASRRQSWHWTPDSLQGSQQPGDTLHPHQPTTSIHLDQGPMPLPTHAQQCFPLMVKIS